MVEAGASRPALEHLRLRQAVMVEGAPQRLLGDAQLLGGPVDADLVGQLKRRLGGSAVVNEPGPLCVRSPAAQRHALAGGGAGEDAAAVVVGLGAVQRGLQAGAADPTAGADRLGLGGLGGLAGLGKEQLRVDLGAGGIQPPVPLPIAGRCAGGPRRSPVAGRPRGCGQGLGKMRRTEGRATGPVWPMR